MGSLDALKQVNFWNNWCTQISAYLNKNFIRTDNEKFPHNWWKIDVANTKGQPHESSWIMAVLWDETLAILFPSFAASAFIFMFIIHKKKSLDGKKEKKFNKQHITTHKNLIKNSFAWWIFKQDFSSFPFSASYSYMFHLFFLCFSFTKS